ncbi:SUKH-4 family immunity protein [Streptomyces sp. NBC_01361]|uniref:SUKH-4 family immunity protein n=1 Tax=Streptomyces sp. NBC_01361 TaxID=2903838 RepID=UPI002E2EAD9F|nr:SUKH-4 family immunity protein [Streptomyces sp. NBC_01361]
MNFAVTPDEVRTVFGLSGVQQPGNSPQGVPRLARAGPLRRHHSRARPRTPGWSTRWATDTPIHRDVESLTYALTKFAALRQELENNDGDDVEERVDGLRAQISELDPLPFEDEDSQWNLAFEEVIDCIW